MSIAVAIGWAVALVLCAGLLWIRWRRRRRNPFTTRSHVIVDPPAIGENAAALVYVNDDGSVRELTEAEKKYVETEFSPLDGARPYIKSRYSDRNGWGMVRGYLPRTEVPVDVSIDPAPPQSEAQPQTPQVIANSLSDLIRTHRRR